MGCDSERNVESEIIDAMLDRSSDGVNMDIPARVLDSETKYRGAIFHVDDRRIALTRNNGDQIVIRRQVLVHAPCVVMLVHDCVRDTYLIEREYRAGIGRFTYGLPAGLIDHDEGRIPPRCVSYARRRVWLRTPTVTCISISSAITTPRRA